MPSATYERLDTTTPGTPQKKTPGPDWLAGGLYTGVGSQIYQEV